eukprot:4088591-Amphidinium_carterae.1
MADGDLTRRLLSLYNWAPADLRQEVRYSAIMLCERLRAVSVTTAKLAVRQCVRQKSMSTSHVVCQKDVRRVFPDNWLGYLTMRVATASPCVLFKQLRKHSFIRHAIHSRAHLILKTKQAKRGQ